MPTAVRIGPRRIPFVPAVATVAVVAALALLGCAGSDGGSAPDRIAGRLTISAAASLTDAFGAVRAAFEASHPEVEVTINFGASSTLATQIGDGAPVDVFASADETTMGRVETLLHGAPVVFATNSLQIIVPKGNPNRITGLADLARPGVVYVTCSPEVPIGRYAARSLQAAGVTVTPRSLEPDVKGIVAKVVAGEADAGIVYATDVTATRGAATGVDIPATVDVTATYPIAMLRSATNATAARAWIDFLLSSEGRTILRERGFGTP